MTTRDIAERLVALAVSDPLVAGNWFACAMQLELTLGARANNLNELCIYEVRDGKIVSEQFTARFDV